MSEELPSPQMALKLLFQTGCSRRVVAHCKAVAALAVQIAVACENKGLSVDTKLVEIGALLHDIGRSKTHGVDHVVIGAEISRSLNMPEAVVSIIERHAGGGIAPDEAERLDWPAKCYIPNSLEEKIVTYADKLIEGQRTVPVERTLRKLSKELGENHSSVVRVKNLHEEISSLIGDLDANSHVA